MRKTLTILTILILIGGMALAQGNIYVADPMTLGVGARSLGMGRTYVGVAEDSDALFVNPAGIARATGPRISTMYSSLMDDIGYTVIGGVYPYGNRSALGAGIINSASSDILLTNTNGSSAGTGQWGNTVLFLSAGTYLNNLPAFANLDKDVLIGGSFKYYSVKSSGSNDILDASDSAGTAYSADIGILYPATEYLTLGANYQNILAGKLTRSSGINEDIPSCLKIGARLALIGKEGQAISPHSTRRLYLNADYDMVFNLPNVTHVGIEFWPTGNFALRAGLDGSNPTMGVGLRLGGIEFNYAYHTYDGIAQNATSFFSLSYLGEAQKRMLRVKVDTPTDKSIIYDDYAKISGKVEVTPGDESEPPIGQLTVKVNGVSIPVEKDNSFSAEVPIDTIGKKMILVEASSTAGDYASTEIRLIRLTNFADVPEGYWAKQPIENTATVGLVEGYPDKTFRPDNALTRAELATLLVRAKGLKLPDRQAQKIFKDVPPDFWAAKYIEVAYREGLIKGYPDKTFRPNNKISKVEGIAIMVRFDNLRVASEVFEKPYWDVPTNHWGARYVQAAKEAGMLKYVERNYLRPRSKLARAEAVEMLSKTSLAGGKIKDLYTWEKGFKPEVIPTRPTIRASIY